MTTVVTDGKTLAADSRAANDNGYYVDNAVKIHRVGKAIIGYAGVCSEGLLFKRWYSDQTKEKPTLTQDFEALVLRPDGVFYFDENLVPDKVPPPYAIGSGSGYAMAATYCGKNPIESVKIAIRLDCNSGGKVRSASL